MKTWLAIDNKKLLTRFSQQSVNLNNIIKLVYKILRKIKILSSLVDRNERITVHLPTRLIIIQLKEQRVSY